MSDTEQVFPDHEDDCLYKIPGTIAETLGEEIDRESLSLEVDEAENVVFFLLDGFGYKYWQQHAEDHRFFRKMDEKGRVEKLKSVYPSETAAAMPSFYTGRTPSQHGMIGWNMYFEEFEQRIQVLPFMTDDWEDPRELHGEEFSAENLFELENFHELLSDEGVDSHVFFPSDIEEGEISDATFKGAETTGYFSLADMAVKLRKSLEDAEGKNYFYCYMPVIDKLSHFEGTDSDEYSARLSQISHALNTIFLEKLSGEEIGDTAVMLTADHGFINNNRDEAVDILEYDVVEENLEEKSSGEKIMPYGGPRSVHLRIKEEEVEEEKNFLEKELEAHIWTKEEALEEDLFGREYMEGFERRLGDIIISHREKGIWYGQDSPEMDLIGYHGGLSKQEMEIPLAISKLEDILN